MTPAYDRDGHKVTTAQVMGPARGCDDCEGSCNCGRCGGGGEIVTAVRQDVKTCPECKGTGKCQGCDGRGYLT